jgi:outer membrane protein assembly factor BamB
MRRLLKIAGVLFALAALAAGGLFAAYKLKWFSSVKTKRGDVVQTNEAEEPPPVAKPKPPGAKPSWTTFRYDERRTGYNPDARVRPPYVITWKDRLPSHGYLEAPPVVDQNVLVVGSYGKQYGSDVTAWNATTGQRLWRKHYRHGSNYAGSAGIGGGRVYITSHDGHLRVYGLKTGKLAWQKNIAPAESPPIVKGDLVYFGDGPPGGNGTFRAVSTKTHRTVWRYGAQGTISSGAALTKSTAYFASYGGHVYALDRFTGKLRWDTAVRGARNNLVPFYSTPALSGGKLVVGGTDGSVYALDARTGREHWRFDAPNYVYPSAAIYKAHVYIGDFSGNFYALSLKNGHKLWQQSIGPIIGSATIIRGLVYISSLRPARTYAFDAKTGRQVWTFPDGQFSPIVADRGSIWLAGKHAVYGLRMKSQPVPLAVRQHRHALKVRAAKRAAAKRAAARRRVVARAKARAAARKRAAAHRRAVAAHRRALAARRAKARARAKAK